GGGDGAPPDPRPWSGTLSLAYAKASAHSQYANRGFVPAPRACRAHLTQASLSGDRGQSAYTRRQADTESNGKKTRRMQPFWNSLAAACLCAAAWETPADAQDWPSKPVKIVVPFSPGGSSDQLARLLAPELAAAFKQQFYIENRAGGAGAVGSAQVARAEPDGYTFVNAGSGPHLTGPAINPNIGYDPLKDFTHIAMEAADSFVLVGSTALGVKSIADLVALARTRPLTSASPGPGSLGQLILERFKRRAGIDIQHVPAPDSGVNEVLGDHISLTMTTLLTVGEMIRAGKVVPLAVTSAQRHPAYPDVPTFAEL